MVLAELEAFLSRPIAPTRRVALGELTLPCDPAPGFGGVLLGAIAARFAPEMDEELRSDLRALMTDLEAGFRIAQPRLRHRFQTDRVGLQRTTYRLVGDGETLRFDFDSEKGTAAQHVLCAVYAAGTLPRECVHTIMSTVRKGLRFGGGDDLKLVRYLSGRSGVTAISAVADPVGWAMAMLQLQHSSAQPSRSDIQRAFRTQLRAAHPDHGATDDGAAARIADLSEARRILLSG